MPGIQRLLGTLQLLGFEIRIWSAGGAERAQHVAASLGIPEAKCYSKPEYPIQPEAALALLGDVPALQMDDDPTERVADWPFMVTPCEGGLNRQRGNPG